MSLMRSLRICLSCRRYFSKIKRIMRNGSCNARAIIILAFKQRSVYIFAFYFHKILPLHTILVNLLSSSPLCHFFVPPASTTRLTFYRITCCVIFCDIHIRGDCLFVCFFHRTTAQYRHHCQRCK